MRCFIRNVRSHVTLLSLLVPIAAAQAGDAPGVSDAFALIHVDRTEGSHLPVAGVFLVAEVPDGYLAFLDNGELSRLEAAGVPVDVLTERDDGSLEYLIAHERPHAPDHVHGTPDPEMRSLYQGEGYRVVAVPVDVLEADPDVHVGCAAEMQRVFRRPLRFVRRPWTDRPLAERAQAVDPAIEAAIANITEAPLQSQVQTLQDFGTRQSTRPEGYQASLWIRDRFLSYGYTDVTLHDYNVWNDNVVCVKSGAVFPEQVVVVGAHYDSISWDIADAPGADDDASGTVGVLETARVLSDIEFERTIIFICFSGEEQGLVGSFWWVTDAVASGMDIIGMINLDGLSYRQPGRPEDLDIITYAASDPMADLAHEVIAAYVPELTTVAHAKNPSGLSSDHHSFWDGGYRALWFLEDPVLYTPYAHTADDVVGLSANDFPFMLKNVKAAAAVTGVFARPYRVVMTHTPLDHSESQGPVPVTATIVSAEPLDASSLQLIYRVDGGAFSSLPLSPTGGPDEYGAEIPAPDSTGSLVEYFLTASDELGFTATSPESAPAELPFHRFRAGVHLAFVDDCEADLGWTLGVPGDNATTGIWIQADPVGTVFQSEDDHTPDPGSICFVTGNAPPGSGPGNNDVDGGSTTLQSPVFDLAGFAWASLSYWRWYADECYPTACFPDDIFQVLISNDGGANWLSLETLHESAFPWVEAVFDDLGSVIPLTSQMRLRFVASDTGGGHFVEALIDDIRVIALDQNPPPLPTAVQEATAVAVTRFEVYPNPITSGTRFRFDIPVAGRTELAIYNVAGALVARPLASELPVGNHSLDFAGSRLPAGVYFARLSQGNRELGTVRLTLVK